MRTQNLIFLVLSFLFFAECATAFKGEKLFTCDQETSQFLASQLYKRRDDPPSKESDCGANETLHIPGVTNYCLDGCDTDCVCKPGYIRTNRKGCILLEENGMTCNKTEVVVCGKPECEKTCDLGPDPFCEINFYSCRYGYFCACKEGYIRVSGGKCIPIASCPGKLYEAPVGEELLL